MSILGSIPPENAAYLVNDRLLNPGDSFDARGSPGPDADLGASPILFDVGERKLVADGDKAGRFFAFDRATGEPAWAVTVDFVGEGMTPAEKEGFLGTAAYADGILFAPTTSRSMVHAIDAASGRVLWARELNERPLTYGDRMFGSTTVTNGVVLQGNAYGQVHALDARDGSILARLDVGGDVQAGISVANETIFVPDAGDVLWAGSGNVTAYRIGPDAASTPTPMVVLPAAASAITT